MVRSSYHADAFNANEAEQKPPQGKIHQPGDEEKGQRVATRRVHRVLEASCWSEISRSAASSASFFSMSLSREGLESGESEVQAALEC